MKNKDFIGNILDQLYNDAVSNASQLIANDPIEFPHRYKNTLDIETAGFIASVFAYGQVAQFKKVIKKILDTAGTSPHDYMLNFNHSIEGMRLGKLYYRISSTEDIIRFLSLLSDAIKEYGSIGKLFSICYAKSCNDIKRTLEIFVNILLNNHVMTRGLRQILPSPASGSACKRYNMYLRWMIRPSDGIDFGIWDVPADKLVIPLDTHILFISGAIGLTKSVNASWSTAAAITETLKKFDPKDPVKYDFSLCHIGISGKCPKESGSKKCAGCKLIGHCITKG